MQDHLNSSHGAIKRYCYDLDVNSSVHEQNQTLNSKASNPILVTGSHRAGTTWMGRMLAAAPNVAYLYEPFNIDNRISNNAIKYKYWFKFISKQNEAAYLPAFRNVLDYNYPLSTNIQKIQEPRDAAKIVKNQSLSLYNKLKNNRPLVKDPIALFSSEWLAETFDMDVLVMIRHPAAFCSSLKLQGWNFNFENFLDQPLLMEAYLSNFEEEIRDHIKVKREPVEQAILMWNCFYHAVSIFQARHPDWLFVRHEDISLEPVAGFKDLYEKLKLEFTPAVEEKIRQVSGTHNPAEHNANNEFVRDSRKNIHNWKKRLSDDEIALIKSKTANVSSLFYSEDEW